MRHQNETIDTRGCKGCVALELEGTCRFRAMFGYSRLSVGAKTYPGGGCKVKTVRDKDGRLTRAAHDITDAPYRPRSIEWDIEKARELYDLGFQDGEIADAVGVSKSVICRWRRGAGLPYNKGNRTKNGILIDWDKVRNLYDQGIGDIEIARTMNNGMTNASVRSWRMRNNLPCNNPKTRIH